METRWITENEKKLQVMRHINLSFLNKRDNIFLSVNFFDSLKIREKSTFLFRSSPVKIIGNVTARNIWYQNELGGRTFNIFYNDCGFNQKKVNLSKM